MKVNIYIISIIFLFISCSSFDGREEIKSSHIELISFDNYFQKISYAIGLDHGTVGLAFYSNEKLKSKLDIEEIENGMVDYLSSSDLKVKFQDVDSILSLYLVKDGTVDSSIISNTVGSYAVGVNEAVVLISSFVARKIDQDIVTVTLTKGISDGFNRIKTSYSIKDAQFDIATFYADINRKKGEDFLKQNKLNPDVVETESGLQYKIFKKGKGNPPNQTDSVVVHYVGRYITGQEFESSVNRPEPVKFGMLQVIKGWTEGLQLMSSGARYRFYVPYDLAYGESGGGPVEPYSALMFDIELIDVIKYIPNH